jgi:hypothetical protein
MTPQLEAAIAAIQPLSSEERQQLLQVLVQSNSQTATLKELSTQFRQGTPISDLLAVQTPTTVRDLKDLAADFWAEEDSEEDFLAFLRQQRHEAI